MRTAKLGSLWVGVVLWGVACTTPPPPDTHEEGEIQQLERELGEGESYRLRWTLASRCLDEVGRPSTPEDARVEYARRALAHADAAIGLEPGRVEGHYYRAVSLGMVLKHSTLPSTGKITELEEAAIAAREIDAGFRCAGSLRLLALLYQNAPAWPIGPELAGETEEIELLFQEALQLAPQCPANHQAYAEFLEEEEDYAGAQDHAEQASGLIAEAANLLPYERAALRADNEALLERLRASEE